MVTALHEFGIVASLDEEDEDGPACIGFELLRRRARRPTRRKCLRVALALRHLVHGRPLLCGRD
eukprot:1734074-Lingulodinium_polyedra.AAC.1